MIFHQQVRIVCLGGCKTETCSLTTVPDSKLAIGSKCGSNLSPHSSSMFSPRVQLFYYCRSHCKKYFLGLCKARKYKYKMILYLQQIIITVGTLLYTWFHSIQLASDFTRNRLLFDTGRWLMANAYHFLTDKSSVCTATVHDHSIVWCTFRMQVVHPSRFLGMRSLISDH